MANASLGQYNFDKEGFDYSFGDGTYFKFDSNRDYAFDNEMKPVAVFMNNGADYKTLPYKPDAAKAFVDKRKDKYSGSVDRKVIMRFHIKFIPVNSKEYKAYFSNYRADDSVYRLLSSITGVEVFEDDELKKSMGQIFNSKTQIKEKQ